MPILELVNETKVHKVELAVARKWAAAITKQISRDFAPIWLRGGTVTTDKTAGAWKVFLRDEASGKGQIGVHRVANGLPWAELGIGTAYRFGFNPTVGISHEILEMLVDPKCDYVHTYPDGTGVAVEVCDPVQSDKDGYMIDRVQVSNFVYPAWFKGGKGPYDHRKLLKAAMTLNTGGYIGVVRAGAWKLWTEPALVGQAPDVSRALTSARSAERTGAYGDPDEPNE